MMEFKSVIFFWEIKVKNLWEMDLRSRFFCSFYTIEKIEILGLTNFTFLALAAAIPCSCLARILIRSFLAT